MIDVICTFCDRDYEKASDIEKMFASFPDYFKLTFVDDRMTRTPLSLSHDVVMTKGGEGAYFARKTGFEATHNKYVWFIDVDDKIFPFTFEKGYDATRFMWTKLKDGNVTNTMPVPQGTTRDKEVMFKYCGLSALWCVVYKRAIVAKGFEDASLEERLDVHEDTLLNCACINHVKEMRFDSRIIYQYWCKVDFRFAETQDEAEVMISHLMGATKRMVRKFYRHELKRAEIGDDLPPTRETQSITFTLNYRCNMNCPYCVSKNLLSQTDLSDEEIYRKFDICLSRMERVVEITKCARQLDVTLCGGEPSLLSVDTIHKIQKRLSGYSWYNILTNGTENEGQEAWHEDERAHFLVHEIDWHGKKLERKKNEVTNIVVTKDELGCVDMFMALNPKAKIAPNYTEEMSFQDYEKLAKAQKNAENTNVADWVNLALEKGSEWCHAKCKASLSAWNVDCQTMKATPCCQRWDEAVSIYDFWGTPVKDCGKCMWVC